MTVADAVNAAIQPEQAAADTAAATAEAQKAERARASAITKMCADAGVPQMAATLIESGTSIEDAQQKIDGAKEIRALVDLARKTCSAIDPKQADVYLAAGMSIDAVRSDLFSKITAVQNVGPIRSQHDASVGTDDAGKAAWKRTVEKMNARAKKEQAVV